VRRNAEEQHAANAQRVEYAALFDGAAYGETIDTRHRRNRPRIFGAFDDKERLDEMIDANVVLANEGAQARGAA
jgi:hypothetical protein